MEISYVKIQNYYDGRTIELSRSVDDFVNIINENKNSDYSILEVLASDTVRFFMDIENIPVENTDLIINLINDFIKFFNLQEEYAYTFNSKSAHAGLSYHVFFPYKISKAKGDKITIYKLVQTFLSKHPQYYKYIDTSIYTKNRLFRVIGSGDPGLNNGRARNNESFHTLIKGTVEDTIIQNYKNIPDFPVQTMDLEAFYTSEEYKKFRDSKENKDRFSLGQKQIKMLLQQQQQLTRLLDLFEKAYLKKDKKTNSNGLFFNFLLATVLCYVCFIYFFNK